MLNVSNFIPRLLLTRVMILHHNIHSIKKGVNHMNSKLTAFFAVLLMIASASAGAALLSDTGPSGINMPGGGGYRKIF